MMKFSNLILVSFLILFTSCRNDSSDIEFNNSQTEPVLHVKKISSTIKGYNIGATGEIKYDNSDKITQMISSSMKTDIIYDAQNRIVQINSYYIDNPSVSISSKKYDYIADKIIVSNLYSGIYTEQMTLFLNNLGLPVKCNHNIGNSIIESYFEYDNNMNLIHHYYNNGYQNNYYSYDNKKSPYYLFPLVLNIYLNEFNQIGKNNVNSIKYFDDTVNEFKTINNLLEYNSNDYLTRFENYQSIIQFYY